MGGAIFFAAGGDTEIEVRIGNLRASALRATVERVIRSDAKFAESGGICGARAPFFDERRQEEEQVIGQGGEHGHFGRQRQDGELQGENPAMTQAIYLIRTRTRKRRNTS